MSRWRSLKSSAARHLVADAGPEARTGRSNVATSNFEPDPSEMRARFKFAALGEAIRHPCRMASPALRCLDLEQRLPLILFRNWHNTRSGNTILPSEAKLV